MTNKYKTQSLALAAAIQTASTSKIELIEKGSNNRHSFVFNRDKDPSFDEIIERFWSKKLLIDAISYFESLRYIKSLLYEERLQS
jgi:hypothetical protein